MDAIAQRWEKVPPLAVSVAGIAAALGVKFETPKHGDGENDLLGLAEMLGGPGELPDWVKAAQANG